jgi:hypothetical protein
MSNNLTLLYWNDAALDVLTDLFKLKFHALFTDTVCATNALFPTGFLFKLIETQTVSKESVRGAEHEYTNIDPSPN